MLSYSLFNRQPIRPIEGDAGTRIGEESRTPNRDASDRQLSPLKTALTTRLRRLGWLLHFAILPNSSKAGNESYVK